MSDQTMTQERIWILGAADPEMEMIEALLRECGERVEYATSDPDGHVRVTPAEAYKCTLPAALRSGYHGERAVPPGTTWYQVECDIGAMRPYGDPLVVIDHHRPGDPGYDRPPEEFLEASSIGQVIAELARTRGLTETRARASGWDQVRRSPRPELTSGWCEGALAIGGDLVHGTKEYVGCAWVGWFVPPPDVLHAAAADHCLAAAYRGECPGVDPDDLMRWRAETRAAFQQRSVGDLLADVERARRKLRIAAKGGHTVELTPGVEVADIRGRKLPELAEASAREGLCFVADGLPDRDGRVKVVCQSGTPEQIQAFMGVWAPAQGLTDIYGDPQRGFAGGYLESAPAWTLEAVSR